MPDLFGVDIAGEIASAFSGQLLTGTLTKVARGARTAGQLTGGRAKTGTTHGFEGFVENLTETRSGGSIVRRKGRYVTVLGGSLPTGVVPEMGDSVTIEGETWEILELPERDPAAATYLCLVEA